MTNWKYLFLLFFAVSFFACQKKDLSNLKDVLHVRRNNADMPAYIYGNGADKTFLVILHGGPGGSGLEYRIGEYKDRLEERYAVVYWDQRGQGMAQGHYSQDDITIAEIVEDVEALALTLRHKYGQDINLFLLGHSWGGTLGSAVLTTENYQDYFQGWIEVDGAHDFPEVYTQAVKTYQRIGAEQIALQNDVAFWQEILKRVAEVDTLNRNLEDFSYMNITARSAEENLANRGAINSGDPAAAGNSFINMTFINSPSLSNASGLTTNQILFRNELLDYSATPLLNRITIPSLILWGANDIVVPVELAQQAFDSIGSPEKELIIYPASGHSPMVTDAGAFASDVIQFIEKHK